jgi:hypothetical protein
VDHPPNGHCGLLVAQCVTRLVGISRSKILPTIKL